jgi:Domain of unknown function (DUF4395)
MQIDPRGPRFGAFITSMILAVVLVTGSAWLLAAQAPGVRRVGVWLAVRALRLAVPAAGPASAGPACGA